MKTILVTGGAGFIGGAFVRAWLADRRCRVVDLDKLTYAATQVTPEGQADDPRHALVVGDIRCLETVQRLLREHRPEAIVHFAAESHVDRSIDGPAPFVDTNVLGTCALLDGALAYWKRLPSNARAHFRFLQVSTDEVYGSAAANEFFDEQSPYAPNSPYAASKAAADHFVRAYSRTYGLPVLTTHCSNNFGPYQHPEKLIPHMILAARDGRPLPVYGDGLQERDWVHVDDHCAALRMVLTRGRPGGVYHVGSGQPKTNLEIVRAISDLVDEFAPGTTVRRGLIQHVRDRPGHDRRYAVNARRLREEFNWRPRWTFESGLRETVRWYLDSPEWIDRLLSGGYRNDRLGLCAGAES